MLKTWKADQQNACIVPRYADLRGTEKAATRDALFIEQTGQCVYCGRKVDLASSDRCHIEHFRPRTCYPNLELAYENLFLSCGTKFTCGKQKASWFDKNCHVEPSPEDSCQQRFEFASDGEILGDGSPEADKMITILNLNHPELIAERLELIEKLDGDLSQNQDLSYCELIQSFLDDSKGSRVSFANVAVHYLRKQQQRTRFR